MAENQKYFYMRLKESFFDSDEMILLESMPDGYIYQNILMKMYLRSLKDGGKLVVNNIIPYNPQMLATVTRQQVGTVEKAIDVFKRLGLIDILDDGTIYMLNIQHFIGKSTTEAERIKAYRSEIDSLKSGCTNVQQLYDKCTPEIDIDNSHIKDISISKEDAPARKGFTPPTLEEVTAYANGRIDAKRFYKYYSDNGWTVGPDKMTDWKKTLDGWARRDAQRAYQPKPQPLYAGSQEKTFDADEAFAEGLEKTYGTAMAAEIYSEVMKK